MAHELTATDTMFSARGITPWHGLGTVVQAAPTIDEAIKLAGLTWTVRMAPNYTEIAGSYVPTPSQSVLRVDTAADGTVTETLLGSVGPGFHPLQNSEAFAWFQPWIDTGRVQLETAGSLFGGARVWILARIGGDPIVVGRDDEVAVFVLLAHAHDGSLAVRAILTPTRVVCNNTLSAALLAAGSGGFRLTHRKGLQARLADVSVQLGEVERRLAISSEEWREMAARQVSGEGEAVAFLGAVYRQSPEQIRKGRRLSTLMDLFEGQGAGSELTSARGTVWGLVQAVTEFQTHHAGKRKGDARVESRADSLAFGESGRITARAFDLGLALARGTFTLESVFGEHSQIVTDAIASHPDALLVDAAGRMIA